VTSRSKATVHKFQSSVAKTDDLQVPGCKTDKFPHTTLQNAFIFVAL